MPHAYTSPSSPDAARCWVPCVDSIWDKCTWEFEFVVPRYLEERDMARSEEEEADDAHDAIPTIVVCSGDLVEQVRIELQSGMLADPPFPRLRTHSIRTRPSFCSIKLYSLLCNTLHLQPVPSTFFRYLLTTPWTIPPGPSRRCMPSVFLGSKLCCRHQFYSSATP